MAGTPRRRASAPPQGDESDRRLSSPRAISKNRVHPYSQAGDGAGWTVPEICEAYTWPKGLEGKGLAGGGTIAIIHLGGGWRQADIDEFFTDPALDGKRPHVSDHSVDGVTQNGPSDPPSQADLEVALDIQIAGASYAVATGQSATIRVYSGPQNPEGLIAAVGAATTDECDVCCITWGADEQTWGKPAADAFNAAAKAAVDNGMIIVAASGDNDSSDGGPTPANVDFPASSPYVVGCGGTKLFKGREDHDEKGRPKLREEVWNDKPGLADGRGTGGGFSEFFPIPDWQLGTVQARRRMVPDVAAHADPLTGYRIFVGGQPRIVGGTSAATALYAGLFAAFGPKRGFITPELYKNQVCFNDIRDGDNGMFRAMVGPDPCTGIGSPRADLLAKRIGSDAATLARVRRQLKEAQAQTAPCPCQSTGYSGSIPTLVPRVAGATGASSVSPGPPGTYARTIFLADGPHVYVWDCDGHMIAQEDFRPCNTLALTPRVVSASAPPASGQPGTYAGTIYLADGPHTLVWNYDGHKVFQEDFRTA
jgi:hypothetical protein